MQDHFVFYIDLLGVSSAMTSLNKSEVGGLREVLEVAASYRAPAHFEDVSSQQSRNREIIYRPEISTFSDHIVISWPILKYKPWLLLHSALSHSLDIIGRLAAEAITHGFLIRGGATIGLLHHKDGVVFGPALVECHNLESRVASYPRVVISHKLSDLIGVDHQDIRVESLLVTPHTYSKWFVDFDGIPHLNYFLSMTLMGASDVGASSFRDRVIRLANENIEKFRKQSDWNRFSKWTWFHRLFAEESARVRPDYGLHSPR